MLYHEGFDISLGRLKSAAIIPKINSDPRSVDPKVPNKEPYPPTLKPQPDLQGRVEGNIAESVNAEPGTEGVSFAEILAGLDDGNAVASEAVLETPPAAASSSEGPEGGSRQTNLSHWLK